MHHHHGGRLLVFWAASIAAGAVFLGPFLAIAWLIHQLIT